MNCLINFDTYMKWFYGNYCSMLFLHCTLYVLDYSKGKEESNQFIYSCTKLSYLKQLLATSLSNHTLWKSFFQSFKILQCITITNSFNPELQFCFSCMIKMLQCSRCPYFTCECCYLTNVVALTSI